MPPRRAPATAVSIAATACGYSDLIYTSPLAPPAATPAIVIPSIRTKGSPSMIMRSAKVPLSPSSALQTMYFRSALVCATVFHLMPVGKPAPPRPRKSGSRNIGENGVRRQCQRAFQALVAVVGAVILKGTRIDHAAAREG